MAQNCLPDGSDALPPPGVSTLQWEAMIDRNCHELDDSLLARAVQDMDEDDCKLEERASEEGAEQAVLHNSSLASGHGAGMVLQQAGGGGGSAGSGNPVFSLLPNAYLSSLAGQQPQPHAGPAPIAAHRGSMPSAAPELNAAPPSLPPAGPNTTKPGPDQAGKKAGAPAPPPRPAGEVAATTSAGVLGAGALGVQLATAARPSASSSASSAEAAGGASASAIKPEGKSRPAPSPSPPPPLSSSPSALFSSSSVVPPPPASSDEAAAAAAADSSPRSSSVVGPAAAPASVALKAEAQRSVEELRGAQKAAVAKHAVLVLRLQQHEATRKVERASALLRERQARQTPAWAAAFPTRRRCQWDALIEESEWMATDYVEVRDTHPSFLVFVFLWSSASPQKKPLLGLLGAPLPRRARIR